ncbi:hypothetical protein EDB85DRAFT_2287570 [Lactarius pseudohatsudake]|nr:hypothetical protein EDB85DRAFT_2287570 [Lactarius pseudohatsudake]
MELSKIWLLLIDHNFQAIGHPFRVDSTGDDSVDDLTKRVKEEKPGALSRTNTDPSDLTVWRCKDPITSFNFKDNEVLAGQISDVFSSKRVEQFGGIEPIAELNISKKEILFVTLPSQPVVTSDQVGSPITLQLDPEYEHCLLHAYSKGGFTFDDIRLNEIVDANARDAPEFVKKYKQMLGRKRKVADNLRGAAERVIGGEDYFDYSTANASAVVVEEEVIHLSQISSLYKAKYWEPRQHGRGTRLFKENDANWLLFFIIADHIDSHPSNIATDGTPRLSTKLGQESWPFELVIKVEDLYHTYRPKSDFLALKFDLPRMAVEVNSTSSGRSAVDLHRMIIQGASVVRFANTTLDTYNTEKNFVFVAIYISGDGQAVRYVLYQKKGSNEVFRNERTFKFANRGERIAFALELYNFCSALADESDNGDTETQVKKLATTVRNFGTKHGLQAFTGKSSKSKRTANDDGENQPERNVRPKGGDGGADEQLEAYGYQVVPDILETEGGTWELVDKLPPNIRTVYRQGDRNKTELIAKHLRKGSKELDIFKYIHTIRPQSPHVISFIETIPSNTGGWLILPKLRSIRYREVMDRRGVRGRDQLGRGLIEGLGYLHEHGIAHRDIKPGNLVCDDDFCLQIIDFDVAIEVQDENTEVDEYRGTRDWTAPEMGEEDGPRAI